MKARKCRRVLFCLSNAIWNLMDEFRIQLMAAYASIKYVNKL